MPSLGPAEILVILVIALLVFGPDKMPDMARQAGKAFAELRRVQQHLRSEISGAMSDLDPSRTAGGAGPDAEPSATAPGGDPVPMLPPKDPSARQPDALPPPPGATGPGTTAAGTDASPTPPASSPAPAPGLGSGTEPADPA
ncbi:MAG: twin-arginine translocase TatA/TatE family subunit [Acidimicrobiia bacterium]